MSQLRVCLCLKVACSITQHHDKSTDYLLCTCTHLCPVGILNHEVWLSSLLYLSSLLVHTTGLLADQAFTNMGLLMRWWLHWKYHFTWSGPCTISVGVGIMFSFNCLLACLFSYVLCLFVYFLCFHFCFHSCFDFFIVSSFTCFIYRLVFHETMYDSWSELGKVQEGLYNYHYLVIYHLTSVWWDFYF